MVELALRATAILVVAWALSRLMGRATAATRHLVWHGALVALVLLPLASVVHVPNVPGVPEVPIAEVRDALAGLELARLTPDTTHGDSSPPAAGTNMAFFAALGTLTGLGTLLCALWFMCGWISATRLSRKASAAPAAWQLEVNTLCERLRVGREVRVKMIDQHSSPLATGLSRAAILLPRAAFGWTDDRRRAVLLHEIAHIKRHDCRVQLIAQIACAMYWFNPLVWFAAAQLRRERERACDDHVLQCGARASSYAAHLLEIARELRPALRPSAALAMARPSELEGRLLSVLAAHQARVPLRATRWAVVTILTLTTVVALGATPGSPQGIRATAAPRYVVQDDVLMSSNPAAGAVASAEATLKSASDPDAREKATLALAFTSGRDVIPALLQALHDSDAQVREKAAIGLALRRDARVVEPLIVAMSDADSQVREKAAIALGSTGDHRAAAALTRALADPDGQVREKAAAGLILLGLTQ